MVCGRGCGRGAGNAALSEVADATADALTSCAEISAAGMYNSNANAISHFMIFDHAPVFPSDVRGGVLRCLHPVIPLSLGFICPVNGALSSRLHVKAGKTVEEKDSPIQV